MTDTLLLDTHVALWLDSGDDALRPPTRALIDDCWRNGGTILLSAVSFWEIAILMALNRLAQDRRLLAVPNGFDLLPVLPDHCKALVALPQRHRDPFDRMLIAQARAERLALLTRDRAIIAYGTAGAEVVTFDARP